METLEVQTIQPKKILDFYPLKSIKGFYDDAEEKISTIHHERLKLESDRPKRQGLTFEETRSFNDKMEPYSKAILLKNQLVWKLFLYENDIYISFLLGFGISPKKSNGTLSDCREKSEFKLVEAIGDLKQVGSIPLHAFPQIWKQIVENYEFNFIESRSNSRLTENHISYDAIEFISKNVNKIINAASIFIKKKYSTIEDILIEKAKEIQGYQKAISHNKSILLETDNELLNLWSSSDPDALSKSKKLIKYLEGVKKEIERDSSKLLSDQELFNKELRAAL